MAFNAVRIGARGTLATLVQGRCVVAAESAVSRSAWIDLTQRLQDRRVHRHGVSDMHPDVRPRDIQRQTLGARAMMQQSGTAEGQIKAVIEAWADAVRRHDLSGILAHHEQDIVMFDAAAAVARNG